VGRRSEILFPGIRVVLAHKPLKGPDAHRLIHLTPAACLLTKAEADIAAYRRQGKPLPNYSIGLIKSSLSYEMDVSGDIYPRRAVGLAGSLLIWLLIYQGPGGTDLHTGGAETAGRFPERGTDSAYKDPSIFIEDKVKCFYPTDFPADPEAAGTANTEVVIPIK
jgi:hypothetical protein